METVSLRNETKHPCHKNPDYFGTTAPTGSVTVARDQTLRLVHHGQVIVLLKKNYNLKTAKMVSECGRNFLPTSPASKNEVIRVRDESP